MDFSRTSKDYLIVFKDYKFRKNADLIVKNSEYDQEIPQSQTADKPMAPRGRATQHSQDTRNSTDRHARLR